MSVAEPFPGQGVGSALLSAAIDWAKLDSNPIEKVELGVYEGNSPGQSLYQKMGFTQEGIVSKAAKIDGQFVDEISMGLWVKSDSPD